MTQEKTPIKFSGIWPNGNGGLAGEFVKVIAEKLNLNVTLVPPPDRNWGSQFPNGSWNGMIGMVNRSEVELADGPFNPTPERNEAVLLTYPVTFAAEVLITPRQAMEKDFGAFVKPFHWQVWLLILCSLFVVTVALIIMQKFEQNLCGMKEKEMKMKSFMLTLKALTQEGSEWLPSMDGSRFLVGMWLLETTILAYAYSGILVAMLTLPMVATPIDSLGDLVRQSKISWRLPSQTALIDILKNSQSEERRLTYEKKSGVIEKSFKEAAIDVSTGKYASIFSELRVWALINEDYKKTGDCRTYVAKEQVLSGGACMVFRKGSPYFNPTNRIILAVFESGLYGQFLHKHYPKPDFCLRENTNVRSNKVEPLDINSLGGVFLMLITGFMLSMAVFAFERQLA